MIRVCCVGFEKFRSSASSVFELALYAVADAFLHVKIFDAFHYISLVMLFEIEVEREGVYCSTLITVRVL